MKPLIEVLRGRAVDGPVPIWLMRQAGRYLPEYRALRAGAGGFLAFCLDPALAAEATLQPIRRYAFDGAIVFSDILVLAQALGHEVRFDEEKGPMLPPLAGEEGLAGLAERADQAFLAPVYEAVRLVRERVPEGTAVIGFAGAPWTLACYMVEGGASKDFARVKGWAYGHPPSFQRLVSRLAEAAAAHLVRQIEAGAEAVQIFDSWAGVLAEDELRRWSIEPMRAIVGRVKAAHPEVPVILFPRGVGAMYREYLGIADALGLDPGVPLEWAARELRPRAVLQGNLDPVALAAGGPALRQGARRILERLGEGRLVFNLGHGVLPHTAPEHVGELVELVRGWRR